jgi:hypothetical protein
MEISERISGGRERPLSAEEGGGPPIGTAWTLQVDVDGDVGWSSDLEHAAPLPRIGERIEFIGVDGSRQAFRVTAVVHTLQPAASDRPPVQAEERGPNSIVADGTNATVPRSLRAGLPRVVVVPTD